MAVLSKFNILSKDIIDAKHNFSAHSFKVMLTNTAPVSTNAVKTDITEIAAGSGYLAGGTATTVADSTSAGVSKVTATNVTFTSTGTIGPFQYAVLYNDTTAGKPLVGWFDYGSAITLANTETFTVAFDANNGVFQIA